MNTAVLISTFLAASIEVIEIVAIVVAVGATRQWRGALAGTLAGLLVLAGLNGTLGTALQRAAVLAVRRGVGGRRACVGVRGAPVLLPFRLAVGTQRRPERLPTRLDDRHRRATG